MARSNRRKQRSPHRRKGRGRLFIAFERALLGIGMSTVAFFIERRLVKAIRKGGVTAAPRTAAESAAEPGALPLDAREGELATTPHEPV